MLYLPKEEGGQGLVHLENSVMAFRWQFIQRYLTGYDDVSWTLIISTTLRKTEGLSLDASLFLITVFTMPIIYQALFKAWTIFKLDETEIGHINVLAPGGAADIRSSAGHSGQQQTGSYTQSSLFRDSETETHSGSCRSRISQHRDTGISTTANVHSPCWGHYKRVDEKAKQRRTGVTEGTPRWNRDY